jgi:hypothetical protein
MYHSLLRDVSQLPFTLPKSELCPKLAYAVRQMDCEAACHAAEKMMKIMENNNRLFSALPADMQVADVQG